MKKLMKKALVGILAATMMFGSVCTAYAATGSATEAPAPTKQENVKADNGTKVNTSSNGTATVTAEKKTTKKSVSVASKVTVDGVKYTVTKIGANTFANAKKATKVTLPASASMLLSARSSTAGSPVCPAKYASCHHPKLPWIIRNTCKIFWTVIKTIVNSI